MTLEQLYKVAEENDIRVDEFPLHGIYALTLRLDGCCAIAIDGRHLSDSGERTALAHELGHCMTGAFYNEGNFLELHSRCEYRADKWAVNKLMPKEELEKAIKSGCTEVWELAERFGVEEWLVRRAMQMYFDK